jgi:hypothetical protein
MRPRSHWDDGSHRRREEEPQTPSWNPPVQRVEHKTLRDIISDVIKYCFYFFIANVIALALLFAYCVPAIFRSIRDFIEGINTSNTFENVGIPPQFVKFWMVCILIGLALGTIVRILRKI